MGTDMEFREMIECPKCHTPNFRVFYKPTGEQGHIDELEIAGHRCRSCGHVEYANSKLMFHCHYCPAVFPDFTSLVEHYGNDQKQKREVKL